MSITPYNFEPLVTDVDNYDYLEYEESVVTYNDRSKLAVTDWCSCGKCEKQINDRECVCCFELANIFKMCTNNECITKNALFSKVVLDEDILKITRQYKISKTKNKTKKRRLQSATMENKAWRFICYKQFTLWVNSWMTIGRGNRVVIPSCVVKNIRERYPEENGLYIGFQNR
ncbi:P2X purinoceptor 7-like [Rhopalosiphum maidis]|uniref:P2X purinoceptor 7-like n=1 Tax=Rhopalosiphum maidis TaxID=43146 RepID=UPI000EFE0293|nr:P2X purinoceptor 7-like [Rhopalosiphum maidis]